MPFGIRSAQEVFHKRIHEIFKDIRGVETDIDDILVWGRTLQEHDDRLKATLDRARECNLKFKLEKCHFRKTSVVYIGHKLTPEGIKPDPEKIEAIVNMPEPEDKKGVQRLLGMVTYVGKFVPNLSEITSPLRELLKKDVAWHWSDRHANAFEEIKTLLSNPQPGVLAYYDMTKSVKLQVDASKSGLGAVLIQSNMPIAYASRSLTSAETRYAQIEKELLAVVFGCNRFRQYIYGKQIIVESDHQPLEAIMKKSLDKSPLRLQRMLLNLQSYDVEVKYRPGNELYLADTLSRAHLSNCKSEEETLDLDYQAISMISKLPVSDGKLRQIKEETKKDGTMQALVKIINEGWPRYKDSVPSFLQPLWNYREELTVIEGVVFKGEKIFIPHALRKSVLAKIHQSHMGIERSKQRARELVYWPGINKDIESVVKSCSVCAEHRASNQKEPMLPHAIPKYPWQIVATDMFYWNGDDYLLVVDYYSRFWEIFKVSNTKSSAIIAKMKTLFARHGIPEIVKSDNGPQYVSREFSEFAKTWGFEHITSSPMYPQSNGLAEKTVQTAKSILTKARRDNQDPNLAILEQRNTPINDIGSPARLSMGRRLRSNMPSSTDQLIPKTVNPEIVQIRLEQKQAQQKKYYDRSAKSREDLSEGDNVYVQREGEWKPAVIMSKADTPRSFNVKTADGGHYRRNSIHLRKSYDLASQSSSPEKSTENQSKKESKATKDERSQREEERGPNEETPTPTGGTASPVRTRSGRVVRKPVRYNDYV